MTTTTARERVKVYLNISGTSEDTIIDNILEDVTPRLAPYFLYDTGETTSTLATDAESFAVTAGYILKKLWYRTDTTLPYRLLDEWRQDGSTVYIRASINTTTYIKYICLRPYTYGSDYTLMPKSAELPLYLFAQAEYYNYIIGNKRKFNLYQQTNGSRTMDEMRDQIEFTEARAMRLCEDGIANEVA